MLVRMCDSCRQVLDREHPCVAVAVRGKTSVALQRVAAGTEPPANAAAHFCADECVVEFVKLWLMDGLAAPQELGAVVPRGIDPAPMFSGPVAAVAAGMHDAPRNGTKPPLQELDEDTPGLPPIPQLPTRREPTAQEVAEQNAILGSVLGGH